MNRHPRSAPPPAAADGIGTDSPERRFLAAVRAFGAGAADEAEKLLAPLIAAFPDHPDVVHLAGAIALRSGRTEEARRFLSHALARAAAGGREDIRPAILNLLGSALRRLGRTDEAVAALGDAVALRPDFADARFNLGNALADAERLRDAAEHFAAAVRLDPAAVDARFRLGLARMEIGDTAGAIADFEHLRGQAPERADVAAFLSAAKLERKEYCAAATLIRQAIALDPGNAGLHAHLGVILLHLGYAADALETTRHAAALAPADAAIHSNLVQQLHYVEPDASALLAEARRWDERHARPRAARIRPHRNLRDPGRRLRIGYVSADFCRHPVGYLVAPLLASHDKNEVEVFCYANKSAEDDLTAWLRSKADRWRNVTKLKDEAVAELVRTDEIDILVDLSGHTGGHRLLAFAERPAPVQATALGVFGTTGLAAIDCLIADRFLIPPEFERFYRERVIRMPDGNVCYAPPENAPPVGPPPGSALGPVTFGSFNNLGKATPATLALWARVLAAVPKSRLLLKGWALDEEETRARFTERADAAGLCADRLILETGCGHQQYLAAHGRVDIALDPVPYSGATTTLDALWMGVPAVTLPGNSFASRYTAAYLMHVGLGELVADSADAYVAIAAALAADRERLAAMRAGLRARLAASPLCDGPRFARNFETAYREMWRAWCAGRRNPLDPA